MKSDSGFSCILYMVRMSYIKEGFRVSSIFLFICLSLFTTVEYAEGCTSAIIGADLNPSGRPLLWKHRDTSNTDNKVEYIPASEEGFGYVALFNATDKNLREAWTGMNEVGFAVMNTASYNIKNDNVPEKDMDKEGFIMSIALRKCSGVEDFANLLDTLPRPLGVEANFGVIDAYGNGAYFETNNNSYVRYNLSDAKDHILVRTNYSHSGREGEGYGFVREANAEHLLAPYVRSGTITPELLTEEISRQFYHDGMKIDNTLSEKKMLLDEDYIPRYKSTATIVIEGCCPVSTETEITPEFVRQEYIMWTGLGYPPVAEIRAVRCAEDGVDEDLRGIMNNGHSPLSEKAKQIRNEIFTSRGKKKYLDISRLYNKKGTGYTQKIKAKNKELYKMYESGKRK